jgi:DNA-binding CsgD family transcriptional regulator
MLKLGGHPKSAASHALHFAKDLLGANAAAYYDVDDDLNPTGFLLSDVPIEFHLGYLHRMGRFDPLHPKHAAARQTARLHDEFEHNLTAETAAYRSFASQSGITDMVELFFRRQDRIVAGISLVWSGRCKIPDSTMHVARKIHDYLEFNLAGGADSSIDEAMRYGLTARELEVVALLCYGRTNREIGECLHISRATVKTHLIHIFQKLGVETRSAAVAMMSRLR